MKRYPVYFIVICLLIFSCSKNQNAPAPSKPTLVKTITTVAGINSINPQKEIDSFGYDNQNRTVYFTNSQYSNSYLQLTATYVFSYKGNDSIPYGYVLSYSPPPPSYSTDIYSGQHLLVFDARNRIVLDSAILATNPAGNNRYTSYGDNMMIHTWGHFASDGLMYSPQIDTVFTSEDNIVKDVVGTGQTQGNGVFTFQWIWTYSYTYDAVKNPLFNNIISQIFIPTGNYSGRNCILTCRFNTADTAIGWTYKNNTDLNGLLLSTNIPETGGSSVYTYY